MANLSLYDLNQLMTTQFANFQSQINNKQNTIIFNADTRWFTDLERSKLSGIQSNAEVNQNAYSYIRVGSNTISANSKTDTLELIAGSNMQLIADTSSKQLTISNTYSYTHPASHPATIITQDSTHKFVSDTDITNWNAKASTAVVTTTTNGLMIAADKTKLDGIQIGAQVNPTNATIFAAVKGLDGSGSGLDADLLDGKDSTDFAAASHNHDTTYLKLNGGTITGQINSTVANGTAPFIVSSSTIVSKLNADLLDGYNANAFALDGHTHTGGEITSAVSNATYATNSDTIDGKHFSDIEILAKNGFDAGHLFEENGYQILANGLILQWGKYPLITDEDVIFNFPIAFPNICLNIILNGEAGDGSAKDGVGGKILSTTQFLANRIDTTDGNMYFFMISLGY